jgi:hypothetical protein
MTKGILDIRNGFWLKEMQDLYVKKMVLEMKSKYQKNEEENKEKMKRQWNQCIDYFTEFVPLSDYNEESFSEDHSDCMKYQLSMIGKLSSIIANQYSINSTNSNNENSI